MSEFKFKFKDTKTGETYMVKIRNRDIEICREGEYMLEITRI